MIQVRPKSFNEQDCTGKRNVIIFYQCKYDTSSEPFDSLGERESGEKPERSGHCEQGAKLH